MQIIIVRNYKDRFPDLKGKGLTDRLILELLGEDAEIVRSDAGKPSLRWDKEPAPPFISVSHSGDLFACVFCDSNVGIDIQEERQVSREKISSRYYSKGEQEYLGEGCERFFQIWTRKEAFAKYTGRGIAQISAGVDVLDRQDVLFWDTVISDDYYLCVCTGKDTEDRNYEIQFFD